MGKRLAISQPAVIQTELRPLSENFWIESSGQLEQWYYQNNGVYSPDRQITPLILSPHLSALDEDTHIEYDAITFSLDRWIVKEWNGTQWVTTEITTGSQSADYVLMGVNLKVQKNSPDAAHAINITCKAQYIDPRDTGMTHWIEESIMLTTNVDATVVYPSIDIKQPHTQAYNPLKASTPLFDFEAVADWSRVEAQGVADIAEYYADPKGTEEVLVQQGSCSPTLDIKYGETAQTAQKFLYRQISNGEVASIPSQRATITKIKGDGVKMNQKMKNGNFEQGSDYWNTEQTISFDIANGICEITVQTNSYWQGMQQPFNHTNHVYLVIADYKCESSINVMIALSKSPDASVARKTFSLVATEWTTHGEIIMAETKGTNVFSIGPTFAPVGTKLYIRNINLIDLTEIYGEGNEPTTVEEFEADYEAWFGKPLTYEPYDEGSIRNVKMTGMKSVGFNQWDEEWESGIYDITTGEKKSSSGSIRCVNKIRVLPSTYYYCNNGGHQGETYYIWGLFYDENNNLITRVNGNLNYIALNNVTFLTPANAAYLAFYITRTDTYNNNVCINISDAQRNGTYEAYKESTAQVPITTLTGKLLGVGESVVVFPQGMNHIGDVYDEIESMFDGGVVKATKRFGVVDLGSLDWIRNNYNGIDLFFAQLRHKKGTNSICNGYVQNTTASIGAAMTVDKQYSTNLNYTSVYIRNDSYSNAGTFKEALSGVLLFYELENPQEYILDELPRGMFEWYGIRNNQEVLIDTLPCYTQAQQESGYGQHTSKIRINALYGDNIAVILRLKRTPWDATPMPMKEYRNVVWKIPPVDVIVTSDKGSAVRSTHGDNTNFTFSTIVNQQGEVISDEVKAAHMVFDWYSYVVGASGQAGTKTSHGSGLTKAISASALRNTGSQETLSTNVYCEASVLGPYEEVTENGVTTYERS